MFVVGEFFPDDHRVLENKMIAIGIDTHLKMHEIEAQDNNRRVLWRGKIGNERKGFEMIREKIETLKHW